MLCEGLGGDEAEEDVSRRVRDAMACERGRMRGKGDGMSSWGFVSVGDFHVRVDCRHVPVVCAWREMRACVHYGVRRWHERVYMHVCDHLHSLRSGCST